MRKLSVNSALQISKFLWPDFVFEHGCYFLAQHSGSNPPPQEGTANRWESKSYWESFINHTHIFDEFRKDTKAVTQTVTAVHTFENGDTMDAVEETCDKYHRDYIAARDLGQTAARLWTLKLVQDFPSHRFRVYYDECDGPVVRFHAVRPNEDVWMTDNELSASTQTGFVNALIYDTAAVNRPTYRHPQSIH